MLGAVDLSQRFGADDAFGVRLNAGGRAPRPDRARRARQPQPARARRRLARGRGDADRGRDRDQPPLAAERSRLQPARRQRARGGRPAHQPQQPAVVVAGGVRRDDRVAAPHAKARRRLARRRARPDAAAAHRRPDRLPVRLQPEPAPDGTYYPDRFCPNGNFDLYDFRSENERRRSGTLDVSLHGSAATGALAHALSARRAAQPVVKQPLPARRPSTSPAPATSTARWSCRPRPTLTDAEHQPRRALDRALRCATRSPSARAARPPGSARATRSSARSATPTDGSRATALQPVVHDAVRRR